MKINAEIIAKLNPCTSRFENFKTQYPYFDGTLSDFVALENITYNDKIWVATRLLSKNQLVHWSILCAESVQPIFESKYPENKTVSNLLAYMKELGDFENLTTAQKDKLHDLRVQCRNAAAAFAAYAADAAAESATATAAFAAYAADYAADYAATEEQRNLNLLLLASLEVD